MVSVCGSCHGLQKHLKSLENQQDTESDIVQWLDTSLPDLRSSASDCRACTLLLNGILLHHERFAGIQEDQISLKAETFPRKAGQTAQDHLSVELRWQEHTRRENCHEDQHEHSTYPNLKLEFFTDSGMFE